MLPEGGAESDSDAGGAEDQEWRAGGPNYRFQGGHLQLHLLRNHLLIIAIPFDQKIHDFHS